MKFFEKIKTGSQKIGNKVSGAVDKYRDLQEKKQVRDIEKLKYQNKKSKLQQQVAKNKAETEKYKQKGRKELPNMFGNTAKRENRFKL